MDKWFVYIVECSDKSLYTGITSDIKRRIEKHNNKTGAKALRGKIPVKLVYSEKCETKNAALKRESEIKSLTRERKIEIINRAASSIGRADGS